MASNSQPPYHLPPMNPNQPLSQPPPGQSPYQHFISQQGPDQSQQPPPWTGANQQFTSQSPTQNFQPQIFGGTVSPQVVSHAQQGQVQSVSAPPQQFVSQQGPPQSSVPPSQHFISQQGQPNASGPPYQHFVSQQSQGPPSPKPAFNAEAPANEDMESEGPPKPSAPDPSILDRVSGYENIGFNDSFIPPPSYHQPAPSKRDENAQPPTIPTISEDEARQALLSEVEKHCCYGKKAARELVFTSITPYNAFHYQLETYTEKRSTTWKQEPYIGQLIDGPQNGPAPGPWDIAAQPNQLFQDHEKHFEVPHSASVKVCHNCAGGGMIQCWRCRGRGTVVCSLCHGSGRRRDYLDPHQGQYHCDRYGDAVRCYRCDGTGYRRCWTCDGCGRIECSVCEAKCKLKWYIKLTVTWKTHKTDHIVERTALPDHLIRAAEGKVAFQDQQHRVYPVQNFPEQDINDASKQMIETHANTFSGERILKQRHWIRIVPVSEVRCDYREESFSYFVYGYNKLVHAPEYPQRICCGCTIV